MCLKIFSFVIFLFAFNLVQSQSKIEVTYSVNYGSSLFESVLIFDQFNSYFEVYDPIYESRETYVEVNDAEDEIFVQEKPLNKILLQVYNNKISNEFLIHSPDMEVIGITKTFDKKIEINWDIIPHSTKDILGLSCKRAEAVYRGSKIVAYFTEQIPTSFGPDKFIGLPGLILEVIDVSQGAKNAYHAIKVDISSENKVDLFIKDEQYIEFKLFVEKRDNYVNQLMGDYSRKKQSQLPREIKLKREEGLKRSGFEKVYEWEEDK